MKSISITHKILAAWLILAIHAAAQSSSRLSSRFLARGEQALLEIAVTGARPEAFPVIPEVAGVEIRPAGRGPQTKLLPGRRLEYVFEYLVSSYDTGGHILPSIEISSGGGTSRTQPIEFNVFNPDELQWSEAVSGATRFRYASAFRALNPRPFVGETTPVEIKIYVPSDLFVEDWGIPDFQRDGLTAWRFQPSAMRGQVNLLGMPYVSVAYPSTLTPTRTGTIGIGPATVRLITTEVVMDGILRRIAREVNLTVPGLELQSVPLPGGAPAGFENAVGDFTIKVTAGLTELQEGDPLPVEIVVSGSGNLDTLRPPKPVDANGWRLYDATTEQRGDERRELSGTTVFRQFLRPLEIKSEIPAFQLVYFDPQEKTYKTVISEPIPLRMTPAPASKADGIAPPEALATPVERMTDILGLLDPASVTLPASPRFPGWLGHAIAALIALVLILKALWMRVGHRFSKDPVLRARLEALREIEQLKEKSGDQGFLLAAGRFIESWLGPNPPPEAKAILEERDARCFRESGAAGVSLDPERRRTILQVLRKAATACCAFFLLGLGGGKALAEPPPCSGMGGTGVSPAALLPLVSSHFKPSTTPHSVMASNTALGSELAAGGDDRATIAGDSPAAMAREAYEAARYDEAISHWLKAGNYHELSADILYNIGNACFRAGSPGHAALYYRRALARDPGHQEARQNLRFIERKYGAITVHRPEFQYAIARVPLAWWQGMFWSGAWLCGLAILVFPATRPANRMRVLAVAVLVIAPLLAAAGALGWRYFPNDAEFAPIERQAVIVADHAILHAEASRTSPEVIDAPPGSLGEVIRESGRWAYISFASKTRGWIPVESIEKIIPETTPAPPKIRKPTADGKSA
jgi:tetratricopeptide (TPR) repeat protein